MMRCECGRPRREMDKLCLCASYHEYNLRAIVLMAQNKAYYADNAYHLSTLRLDMHEAKRPG